MHILKSSNLGRFKMPSITFLSSRMCVVNFKKQMTWSCLLRILLPPLHLLRSASSRSALLLKGFFGGTYDGFSPTLGLQRRQAAQTVKP